MKTAEAATLRLLPTQAPSYTIIPEPPREQERLCDFLHGSAFRGLHAALDPGGGVGDPGPRGARKRAQITAMLMALSVLAPAVGRKGSRRTENDS